MFLHLFHRAMGEMNEAARKQSRCDPNLNKGAKDRPEMEHAARRRRRKIVLGERTPSLRRNDYWPVAK
jgi:hypothetical protein